MTPKAFSELGISPEVLKAIDKLGFEQAAPIQAEAIPILLQARTSSANPKQDPEKPRRLPCRRSKKSRSIGVSRKC